MSRFSKLHPIWPANSNRHTDKVDSCYPRVSHKHQTKIRLIRDRKPDGTKRCRSATTHEAVPRKKCFPSSSAPTCQITPPAAGVCVSASVSDTYLSAAMGRSLSRAPPRTAFLVGGGGRANRVGKQASFQTAPVTPAVIHG